MKTRIIILTFFIPVVLFSQKYFLLDSLKKWNVKEYTLDTKEIYNLDRKIIVYNVFVTKESILLFSVLPDLEENGLLNLINKKQNWSEIDFEKIKDQVFSTEQIKHIVFEWSVDNTPDKKTLEYKLIKKEKGKYYISKNCLTEFFKISNIEVPLISNYGVINILDRKVTIKEMQNGFNKQFPHEHFIMDLRENSFLRNMDISYSFRNYLSKEVFIRKDKAYQFWTFDGWWTTDGYNEHRGIDRFLYIPDKGIVGGSYDFYFRFIPKISNNDYNIIPVDILWENIISEKIMIANEIR